MRNTFYFAYYNTFRVETVTMVLLPILVLSLSSPVVEVTEQPTIEAKQNAITFSFYNMTIEEV